MLDKAKDKKIDKFGYIMHNSPKGTKSNMYIGYDWRRMMKISNIKLFVEDRSNIGKYSKSQI